MRSRRPKTIMITRFALCPMFLVGLMICIQQSVCAQGATQAELEKRCFDSIQGKVAWNKTGDKMWDVDSLRTLCKGTSNPLATAHCVSAEINKHDDWSKAVNLCKSMLRTSASRGGVGTRPASRGPGSTRRLTFGTLKNVISDGCSCSARNLFDKTAKPEDEALLFITDVGDDSPLYLNINGEDKKFSLVKRGPRPDRIILGSTYEDTFQADGITATVRYVVGPSSCPDDENCESRDFNVTIILEKDGYKTSITTPGICGC